LSRLDHLIIEARIVVNELNLHAQRPSTELFELGLGNVDREPAVISPRDATARRDELAVDSYGELGVA